MHLAFTVGLLAFALLARRAWRVGACHAGWGGGGGPGVPRGRGWRHGGPWRLRRALTRRLLGELDASPEQARVISAELTKLERCLQDQRLGLRELSADLAMTFSGAELDEAALTGAGARLDAASVEVRAAALEALRAIHGVLDPDQRARLVHLWARAPGQGPWHGAGPYR